MTELPEYRWFNALVQRHVQRVERNQDEIHDGWVYCWCAEAKAIRAAAEDLPIQGILRAADVRHLQRDRTE